MADIVSGGNLHFPPPFPWWLDVTGETRIGHGESASQWRGHPTSVLRLPGPSKAEPLQVQVLCIEHVQRSPALGM